MLQERENFMRLVLRTPVAPEREQVLAEGELMDRLAHARPAAGDDSLATASERLQRRPARHFWPYAIATLILIPLLGVLTHPVLKRSLTDFQRLFGPHLILSWFAAPGSPEERLTRGFSEEQRRFFLRNTGSVPQEERAQWMIEAWSEGGGPDRAAIEEWALLELDNSNRLSAVTLEAAKRQDPNNGIWAVLGGDRSWLKQSLAAEPIPEPVQQFLRAPEMRVHLPELTARRLAMVPPAEDLRALHDRLDFFNGQRTHPTIQEIFQWLSQRAAHQHPGHRQPDRWLETAGCLETLWRRPPDPDASPAERLVWWRQTQDSGQAMLRVASAFSRPDLRTRFREGFEDSERMKQRFDLMRDPLLRLRLPQSLKEAELVSVLPGFDPAGLAPGRKAEHALADGFTASAAAWFFILLAGSAGLNAVRRPPGVNALATGLAPLWRPVDWAWLIGLGLLLPLAWHGAITRLTPFGLRDLAAGLDRGKPLLLQATASWIFALMMIVQTVRWRWMKRGSFCAALPGKLWQGDALAFLAGLCVPAAGALRYVEDYHDEALAGLCATGALPVLWLLWRAGALVFAPREACLGGVLICRKLCPAFLLSALVLLGSCAWFKREERRWVAADGWSQADPSGRHPTRLQAAIAAEMADQIDEARAAGQKRHLRSH